MEIQSQDYKGQNRRNNGKLRLTFSDWRLVITIFATLLVSGTIAWTNIKADVVILKEKASEVKDLPTQMAVLQTDVEYIKGDMQEVKSYVNEIKTDIKTLLRR